MSKRYTKKKRGKGGNIITRRSNRITSALPSRKSSNRYRHQLHPKVSTTLKPVVSKTESDQRAENDFMKIYNAYTYSDNDQPREQLGINHPLLKDVSINDYMNAIENIKLELEKTSVGNSKDDPLNVDMETLLSQDPIIRYSYTKKGESDHSKRNKRPHSVGGRMPAGGPAQREDQEAEDVLEPEDYAGQADLASIQDLKDKLNSTRLMALMQDTESAINSTWKRRADLFLRHMFIDRAYRKEDAALLLPRDQPNPSNYSFHVRIPHSVDSATGTVEVKAGPGKWFKFHATIITLWNSFTINDITPSEEISGHTELNITETVAQFQGKYNNISNVEQRHIIYSTLLFILANSNENDVFLRHILDQFNRSIEHRDEPSLTMVQLKFINSKISNKIKNSLPYSLFYTIVGSKTYTHESVTIDLNTIKLITIPEIKRHIDGYLTRALSSIPVVSRTRTALPVNSMNQYKQLLDFMYGKIFGNNEITTSFNVTVRNSDALHITHIPSQKLRVIKIRHDHANKLVSWFFLNNTDRINCTRINVALQDVRHVITNDKGTAIFYTGRETINITVKKMRFFRSALGNPYQMNLITEAPLTWRVWYQDTRIHHKRDKLMGYLSELVYCPNDIVEHISTNYLTRDQHGSDKLIYIGPFDRDPSFPLSSTGQTIYSRIHVWMRINTVSRRTDTSSHELYIVSRGSKTGYDWTSADRDIQQGVLHSFRSSHVVTVLKDIIEYLNNSIRDGTEKGLSIYSGLSTTPKIQLFSAGHSLGGYLSLYLSLACLSNNIMNGISFPLISGTTRVSAGRFKLNPYVIPIVFDPFVASLSLMGALSYLPYARIHSCIDSSPIINTAQVGRSRTTITNHTYSTMRAVTSIGENLRYNDAASGIFLDFIRAKYYNVRVHSMGRFDIFEYSNSYNFFTDSAIYHKSYFNDRFEVDMRISHDMCQIVGLSLNYIVNRMMSSFNISTPYDRPCNEQNIQAVRYSFPIPNDSTVLTRVTGDLNRIDTPLLQEKLPGNDSIDAYNIIYRPAGRNIEKGVVQNLQPLTNLNLFRTCEDNIRRVRDEFIQTR